MRLRSSAPKSGKSSGQPRITAEPTPYGTTPRRTGMLPPTNTFIDAFTAYLQAKRRATGYLVLFFAVGAFALIAASVLRILINQYDELRQAAMDRPVLIERRQVDAADLDWYSLHAFYDNYYGVRTTIKLVQDHGVTRLLITDRDGNVLLKRRLVPSDLDRQRILARYEKRTGNSADTVDLYYKGGRAMLVVKDSELEM